VFIGNTGAQALYPADNTFVGTLGHVGFVNAAGGDYELQPTSPFKRGATDGTDVGVNFDLMDAGDVSTTPRAPASPTSSPAAPTLSVSPMTTTPGGTVTVTWSGIAAPTSTDWIGLYAVGTANTAELASGWIYVNCTESAGAARASGSCAFTVPSWLSEPDVHVTHQCISRGAHGEMWQIGLDVGGRSLWRGRPASTVTHSTART
jgi:hypothetical protein